jgi:recombination protein RecT
MNDVSNAPTGGGSALQVFRAELPRMTAEFKAALPSHISVAKFTRVIQTAVAGNPDLLKMDRRALWKAAIQAATDGLLPDGKQGAIVPRWNGRTRCLEPAWQPMAAGVRIKARNTGEIGTWDVEAVYANDAFEFELGDDPFIRHRPALSNRGDLVAVYSICTLKGGEKSRVVMGVDEIYQIRNEYSESWKAFEAKKIKKTPWHDSPGEMAKKTVLHRHSKSLPMSTDLEDVVHRAGTFDAALPNAKIEQDPARVMRTMTDRLDMLAADPSPESSQTIEHDPQTGEIQESGGGTPENEAPGPSVPEVSNDAAAAPPTAAASTSASAADDADFRHGKLIGKGLICAEGGAKDLDDYFRDLDTEDQALITPADRKRLSAIAQKRDQEMKAGK